MDEATQVTDHSGGVHSIRVPIPDNPLGFTLVYLVDTDAGPVLIDTGWDDPTSWDALTTGLTACGTSVEELTGILITHHHPDHHGLSEKVREASGAWIAMHEADVAVVRRTRENKPARWYAYMVRKLVAAGAPEDHIAPLIAARDSGKQRQLPGFAPRCRTAPSPQVTCSTCRAAGCARSGRRATPRGTYACTWKRNTPLAARATAASSPATTYCPASPRTSACTRTRTTPPSPTRSATTSTRSNEWDGSTRRRSSRHTSTRSPTPRRAWPSCWTTTRTA